MDDEMTPKSAVIALMLGTVPERKSEVLELWERYPADVILVPDAGRVTLNANRDRIAFDGKTMDVFWLIGFAGWWAIECYGPLVALSAAQKRPVAELIAEDTGLGEVEREYKERLAAARAFITGTDGANQAWPPDIPMPSSNREAVQDDQYRTAYDLTLMATAFAFFHEFRHVILDRDGGRHDDMREEELACDVWAREFMTAKLAEYAAEHGHDYEVVLCKRSMGLALASLILYEITPIWDHGGNACYFSISDRLRAILDNTPLPENSYFWQFAAALLIGIFRQAGRAIDSPAMGARALARHLLDKLQTG